MKLILTLAALLAMTTTAYAAAPTTCADLEAAYKADLITEISFECFGDAACEKIQYQQLRATAADKAGPVDPSTTDQEMNEQFEPFYVKLFIGNDVFDGVNVSLGDNPFVSYFEDRTTNLISISSDDGSVSVGGKYCDVELAPYMSDARKKNACELIIADVNKQTPGTKFDLAACLLEETQFYIEGQARTDAEIAISRNLADVGGGYFSCAARLDRTNDKVFDLDCEVR